MAVPALRLLPLTVSVGVICAAVVLAACGSGSSMHSAPLAPIFTSTPGTAASQGAVYSYQPAATDPAGGSVTFSLTTAPSGTTLSGGTLAWTPAAAQSRISDVFTIAATTTSGGTAMQSWTVTPAGTITVATVGTNWTSTGPQTFPGSFPIGAAIVLNADGSVTVISGSFTGPGVFSIPAVPAGYYWLVTGLNLTNLFDAFWTSSSTVDLGRDIPGPPTAVTTKQSTTFNFEIAGLTPTAASSLVDISTDFAFDYLGLLDPAPEASTVTGTSTVDSVVDWSKVDTVFLAQYEPVSLGTLNKLVLGPELTLSNPAFTDGGTNTIAETLQPSPQISLNVTVPGSQWASLFRSIGPSAVTAVGSWLSVSAEPFITGRNQSPTLPALNLPMVTAPVGNLGEQLLPDFCLNGSANPLDSNAHDLGILSNENFGTLDYGDPFPSSWTRAVAFCQVAAVPIAIVDSPGTSLPFFLPFGVAVPPSSSPSLAPIAEPVLNPTINGANLFTESTLNTTAVTLSWSAPQGTAPFGYRISVLTQTAIPDGVQYAFAGEFGTANISATLPPLTASQTYVFIITTAVDGAANMETSPWRSALPTGFANIISAPITISSGATTPAIHGDAKAFAELFSRRVKINTVGVAFHQAHH